jgi:hypothetical protein
MLATELEFYLLEQKVANLQSGAPAAFDGLARHIFQREELAERARSRHLRKQDKKKSPAP